MSTHLAWIVVVAIFAVSVASVAEIGAVQSRRAQQWSLEVLGVDHLAPDLDGSGVVVAVLDTDFAAGHQDLAPAMVPGYDFVEDRPFDPEAHDRRLASSDHGTMVASIIAAPRDGSGIDGIAPGVTVMPVRIVPDVGQGTAGDMAAGINWALDNGADIINISIRTSRDSAGVRQAIERAEEMDVVVVASAGLAPTNLPFYPAAYPTTLAVGAVDSGLNSYSGSPAAVYVDVAAPGVGVVAGGGEAIDSYRSGSGTSFAAPHVTAVVALVRSGWPELSAARIRSLIADTSIDLGDAGRDDLYGAGLIDPIATLTELSSAAPNSPVDVTVTRFGNRVLLRWTPPSGGTPVERFEAITDGRVVGSTGGNMKMMLIAPPGPASAAIPGVRAVALGGDASDPSFAQSVLPTETRIEPPSVSVFGYWICGDCYPADLARRQSL